LSPDCIFAFRVRTQVQHPAPTTAVHDDSSCFQEEGKNHKASVQEDVPGTEVVEEAPPGAEEARQVHANDVAEEEKAKAQDEEDSDKEKYPTDDHEEADECLQVQAVAAQELDSKLRIVHDDVAIVDDDSAPAADDEAKVTKEEEEAEEPRREVTRKAARAAKAVVVPVDDDYDGLVDGEATAPPEKVESEAPAEKEEEEDSKQEG
jgi:hypothetical protein